MLLLRSCRGTGEGATSNILWSYGHTTIPRHLRDVFVTEYGVADLRGKSDEDCVQAMLAISDARYLDGLVAQAKKAGKLAADFAVPERWRGNTPERLALALKPFRERGLFPALPFGSDFDPDELRLLPALGWLKRRSATVGGKLDLLRRSLAVPSATPETGRLLARLGLDNPRGLRERLLRRLVQAAMGAVR